MGRRTSFEHVAHLFCELYLKLQSVGLAGDHRCPLPITQTDLADALGLTPVHINRVLQGMRGRTLSTLRPRLSLPRRGGRERRGTVDTTPYFTSA
ncbi:helix-turn-helix domain-containing protein [Methylobacterium sp. J-088]|uniref:helix-turn-helix domain-containing protein n=1 Tax=Methylobacterium sp. J-088 TaxID=2836664 RepID=UPI0028C44E8A|nr:helix-turn-helix domain-containing protein [Methylobacterium sp. J-088]